MNDATLTRHLQRWAAHYAGAQFQRLGYSSTERLATQPIVSADPRADEIERIVQAMEQAGRWKEARVLRAECFLAGLAETERLQRLNRIGLAMGRSAYYAYLGAARAFVLGALLHPAP